MGNKNKRLANGPIESPPKVFSDPPDPPTIGTNMQLEDILTAALTRALTTDEVNVIRSATAKIPYARTASAHPYHELITKKADLISASILLPELKSKTLNLPIGVTSRAVKGKVIYTGTITDINKLKKQEPSMKELPKLQPVISISGLPPIEHLPTEELSAALEKKGIKLLFRRASSAVCRADGQTIHLLGGRLVVANVVCRIGLSVIPKWCNKCHMYGHSAKHCLTDSDKIPPENNLIKTYADFKHRYPAKAENEIRRIFNITNWGPLLRTDDFNNLVHRELPVSNA